MVLEGPDLSACTCSQDACDADRAACRSSLLPRSPALHQARIPPAPSCHSSPHFLPFGGCSSMCWHCPFPFPPSCSPLFFQSLVPLPFRCASCDQIAPSFSDQQFPPPYPTPPASSCILVCSLHSSLRPLGQTPLNGLKSSSYPLFVS